MAAIVNLACLGMSLKDSHCYSTPPAGHIPVQSEPQSKNLKLPPLPHLRARSTSDDCNDKLKSSWAFDQNLVWEKPRMGWKITPDELLQVIGWSKRGQNALEWSVCWAGCNFNVVNSFLLLEYGRNLEDDIRSDTSFMFQRVLVSLAAVSTCLPIGWLFGWETGREGGLLKCSSLAHFQLLFSSSQIQLFPGIVLGSRLFHLLSITPDIETGFV